MYSRILSLLFSIAFAFAQDLFQDSTESADTGAGAGAVTTSDPGSSAQTSNSDILSILPYNSEAPKLYNNFAVIPESSKTDQISNPDPLNLLSYDSKSVHDIGSDSVTPETYSNGPFSSLDASNSGSPEAYGMVVPDLKISDPSSSDNPTPAAQVDTTSNSGSDEHSTPNPDSSISLSPGCTPDNSATSQDKRSNILCPADEFSGALEQQSSDDFDWVQQQYNSIIRSGRRLTTLTTPKGIQNKCRWLGKIVRKTLIATCCLGPPHFFRTLRVRRGTEYRVTNEENCGTYLEGRPICGEIDREFCCASLQGTGLFTLAWGIWCIKMI